MTVYTVHEPATPGAAMAARADAYVFVKEGFSLPALLLGPLWLLARGLWLELILFLAAMAGLSGLLLAAGQPPQSAAWASWALSVLLAFEFHDLERWKLERRGYRLVAAVSGGGQDEAERRFFSAWLQSPASAARPAPLWAEARQGQGASSSARSRMDEPVIGFLPPAER